ncbi:MAG: hypothetical protein SVM86_07870 [Candidatus Cloacimonadota bacterium]|nr:hypothetical protein [Candidatus Cloacimonadota bacterium]
MKKVLILASLFILGNLWAHPASELKANYNPMTHTLTLEFEHKVRSIDDHFINKIEIEKDGVPIITQHTQLQQSSDGGEYIYKILGLKAGEEIKITINCNKFGKKVLDYTIPDEEEE